MGDTRAPTARSRPSPAPRTSACPACARSGLVEFAARPGSCVELCQLCKGLLVAPAALEGLLGVSDLTSLTQEVAGGGGLGPCSRCHTVDWQWRVVTGVAAHAELSEAFTSAGVGTCRACGTHWLESGQLERLTARSLERRRRARAAAGASMPSAMSDGSVQTLSLDTTAAGGALLPAAGSLSPGAEAEDSEPADRVSFDRGVANGVGVPLALVLALGFCSTSLGQFFGGLVGMPFHELGHALTSWLSSRFAVPLPFFTIWHEAQSRAFGLVVALSLAGFALHSWRERRRFGVLVAGALLSSQIVLSVLVPARLTLMLQILGGCLGEIVLGGLVLVAFHFPLPDRLRWDFWRWPALVPGAICFVHALLIWSRARSDVSAMPWGSAIGDDSDGDMNRLVYVFGWRALELASFYSRVGWASLLAIGVSCTCAWLRVRRAWRPARAPGR